MADTLRTRLPESASCAALGRPASSQSVPEWLSHRARLSPERPAIFCDNDCLTFADLDRLVAATARGLAATGVRGGDRVALLARNGIDFVRVVHAVTRLGAAIVPLHARWSAIELARVVRDCGATLLAHDDANATTAASMADLVPATQRVPITTLAEQHGGGRDEGFGPHLECMNLSRVHSVVYTSGTSGTPKGTVLTYGNHLWNAMGSALNLGLRDDDRWLACLPLYHVGGLAILLRGVVYGIPVVLHERFEPAAVNRDIDEKGITIISVVSAMLVRMLEERQESHPYPPSLRCVLVGGGPVPHPLLDACARRSVPVAQTYGLTEAASQVTTLPPGDALGHPGSAGKQLFFAEVRIAGKDGDALPPGELGEILVRGPTVTPGYLDLPQETEAALRGGWLHTGDIGYLDAEGYLYVRDRRDDVIVSGGENVYAAEVEEVLCSHPAVKEAGVTGVPDTLWGERVVATVSLRDGVHVSEADLISFCRSRLAPYKIPRRVRFAGALPRNAAGKLLRRALREEHQRS